MSNDVIEQATMSRDEEGGFSQKGIDICIVTHFCVVVWRWTRICRSVEQLQLTLYIRNGKLIVVSGKIDNSGQAFPKDTCLRLL